MFGLVSQYLLVRTYIYSNIILHDLRILVVINLKSVDKVPNTILTLAY